MRLHLLLLPGLAAFALSCREPTEPEPDTSTYVVAGNGFSCALAAERAWCWGKNDAGQLGRGVVGIDEGPGAVAGGYRFRLLAAGERTACGLSTDNAVICWGSGRIFGSSSPVPTPTPLTTNYTASITALGVGFSHGCVLTAAGSASCFGTNSLGEVGNGTNQPATGALSATTVTGGRAFSQLSVGAFHSCGLQAGEVWCWGGNFAFVFGPGTTSGSPNGTPTKITLPFSATRIEAGSAVTCALDATSKAWCWGSNVAAQLGRGIGSATTSSPDPVAVGGGFAFTALAMPKVNSTITHTCGSVSGGGSICWGLGDMSQLGRIAPETCVVGSASSPACSGVPGTIESTLLFKQLALGRDHSCGVTSEDQIYCWGSDAHMQIGATVGGPTKTPVRVIIPTDGAP